MAGTYKIVRSFANGNKRTIKSGLSLAKAKKHCKNPETSSRTATGYRPTKLTKLRGAWFDGFEAE